MTKADFVELVQKNGEFESKAAAERAVKAFISSVTDALVKKETVSLVGFGTFSTSDRAARDGRNPRTGETIKIPAKTLVKFKAGKALSDSVN